MDCHAIKGILNPTPPFDFHKSLDYLRVTLPAACDIRLKRNSLAMATSVDKQVVMFRLRSSGSVDQPKLNYLLISDHAIVENTRLAVLDQISHFLSLYDNLDSFYRIGSSDRRFTPVLRKLYGYHPVKFLTPFENACWAVLQQHIAIADAAQTKQRLTRTFGRVGSIRQLQFNAFPEPADLAYANRFNLGSTIKDDIKAEALQDLARAFTETDDYFLQQAPYDTVFEWLLKIRGLSNWSATDIMLQGLGRTDRVPASDRRLVNSAARLYGKMIYGGLSSIAEQYGPWQGYWAQYLKLAA